ncbi:MAG: hypothetical protein AAFR35_09485 [Pseudomonadota bacterium]
MERSQQVYILLVDVGRKPDDGLPEGSTGAGLLCFASGVDEAEAVRETVAVLKTAGLAPLEVTGHGLAEESDPGPEEQALIARALDENAVIVAEVAAYSDTDQAASTRKSPAS